MNFSDSVLVIIVLYKQQLAKSNGIVTLDKYLHDKGLKMDLFVYDNSPISEGLDNYSFKTFQIKYVHDALNSGVSKAYNSGVKYATQKMKKWVLLIDQDTIFPEYFLDEYQKSVQDHPSTKLFAPILKTQFGQILSPCAYIGKRGYWLKNANKGFLNARKYSPVNSGMLIDVQTFKQVGGYNEKVRLDFADFQFLERYAKMYACFYVVNLLCEQNFSGFENNLYKLKHRFELFCESAANCQRDNFTDNFKYLLTVFRRTIGLTIRTKNVVFLSIFLKKYFFR